MFFRKKKLTTKDIKLIPKSFDIVGEILIFTDFPKELKKKEKLVGDYLTKKLKNIKTVAKKTKHYSGKYRTPKLKILTGNKSLETIHKENGVKIKINPEKAYFSPRTGSERLRIAKQIKKDETILVLFSGVMPFGLTIAKHSKAKEIYGIEINPKAHEYAKENVKLNKINNIKLIKGDVNKAMPKIKFNRIIMPHPSDSERYLKIALKHLKPKGKIYLYVFEKEENFKKLKEKYKKFKPKLVKAGSPAPGKFRVCVELKT
ncbi:methyltransferase [archaeon]|nr:methyltransferase [archaeon]